MLIPGFSTLTKRKFNFNVYSSSYNSEHPLSVGIIEIRVVSTIDLFPFPHAM